MLLQLHQLQGTCTLDLYRERVLSTFKSGIDFDVIVVFASDGFTQAKICY
jgi:hypothetical protein